MSSDHEAEIRASVAAHEDLGPGYDDAVAEGLVERIGAEIDKRIEARLAGVPPGPAGPPGPARLSGSCPGSGLCACGPCAAGAGRATGLCGRAGTWRPGTWRPGIWRAGGSGL